MFRSFDVNKPGSDVEDLKGGVAGGSILKGWYHIDDFDLRSQCKKITAWCMKFL